MNLRIRTLLAVFSVTIGLMIAFYLVTRTILWGSFRELEGKAARDNTERLALAVASNIASLDRIARDYAQSAETYRYVAERQPEYLVSSLNETVFANYELDNVVIFDLAGRAIYEASYNPQAKNIILRAQSLITYIRNLETQQQRNLVTRPTDPNGAVSGLVLLPEGPMMIAMQPILPSDNSLPLTGTVVMARYLDVIEEKRLSEQMRLPVSFVVLNANPLPEDLDQVNQSITLENPIYIMTTDDLVSGFSPLFDIVGRRILLARVDVPQDTATPNANSQRSLYTMTIVGGVVLALAMSLVSYLSGLLPMSQLQRKLRAIRQKNAWSTRIQENGKDEFASLVGEVNELLANNEQATKEAEQGKSTQSFLARALAVRQVTQTILSTHGTEQIVRQMVAELGDRFNYYYVGIFLLDELRINAVLRAGTGNVVPEGYHLTVGGSSSVGMCIVRKEIQIAEIGSRKDQLSFTRLPMARSEAAAPIRCGDEVLGAIAVQSTQSDTFKSPQEQEILQYLADYAGSALMAAKLIETLQKGNRTLENRYQQFLVERWSEELRIQNALHATYQKMDFEVKGRQKATQVEVPMVLDGVVIGRVEIELPADKLSGHGLSTEVQELVNAILAQTTQALENARLLDRSQRRVTQERLVTEVVSSARTSTKVDTILNKTVLELGRLLRASTVELRIQPKASTILLEQINQDTVLENHGGNGSTRPIAGDPLQPNNITSDVDGHDDLEESAA